MFAIGYLRRHRQVLRPGQIPRVLRQARNAASTSGNPILSPRGSGLLCLEACSGSPRWRKSQKMLPNELWRG